MPLCLVLLRGSAVTVAVVFNQSQQVVDAGQGTEQQHARTGIPHDAPDLFAAFRAVTMDFASGADWFIFSERTMIKPVAGILQQILAIRAEFLRAGSSMMPAAVAGNHARHRLFFFFNPTELHGVHRNRIRPAGCMDRLSRRYHKQIRAQCA